MKLYTITRTHTAPKSQVEAVVHRIIADSEEPAYAYCAKIQDWGAEWADEEDEGSIGYRSSWWDAHPDAVARAEALGLEVSNGDVVGPLDAVRRWNRGPLGGPEDVYYGHDAYSWDEGVDITDADAEVLVRLGLAVSP